MPTEIAPGIFTSDHQVADGKNCIIFGERAVLAIDAGTYAEEGQMMVDFIRSQGRATDLFVLTHGHPDHVLGSRAFSGAEVIAHALCPVEIDRLLPAMAKRIDVSPEEARTRIAWPTITFSDELHIDLGDKRLRLFPTPGHSQDGISAYIEAERLLVAGDAVVTSIVPAIGNGDSRILEATLRNLLVMEIEVMVPGHGDVVRGAEAVRGWLRWGIDYLSDVRGFVQAELARGVAPDEIIVRADYDRFIGDRLPKDRHKMPNRHRASVTKIVEEEIQDRS